MGRQVFVGSPPESRSYEDVVAEDAGYAWNVARGVLREPSLAEDAVQEAFVALLARDDPFPSNAALRGWLGRVAYNAALKILRARRRRRRREDLVGTRAFGEAGTMDQTHTETDLLLGQLVDDLPDEERLALRLKYFQGVSQREIASLLDCSTGTVSNRIRGAVERLRGALRRAGAAAVSLPVLESRLAALPPDPLPPTLLSRLLALESAAVTVTAGGGMTMITKLILSGCALAAAFVGGTFILGHTDNAPARSGAATVEAARAHAPGEARPHLVGRGEAGDGAALADAAPAGAPPVDSAPVAAPAAEATASLTLRGVVLDPEGVPAAKARVSLETPIKSHPRLEFEALTDDEGVWTINDVPGGRAWVLEVRHGNSVTWRKHVSRLDQAPDAPLETRLAASWSVRGRLFDPAGEPLTGTIPVDVLTSRQSGRSRVVADAEGAFEFAGMDPSKTPPEQATFVFRHPDYVPLRVKGWMDRLGPDGWAYVDLRFEYGASVHGVVRGPGGAQIAKASLWLLPANVPPDGFSWEERRFQADESGAYRIGGLAPGDYVLRGWAPGLVLEAPLELTAAQTDQFERDLVFGAGRTITGRVVDKHGTAIPTACVSCPRSGDMFASVFGDPVDEEGRFRFTGLSLEQDRVHLSLTSLPLLRQDSLEVEVVRSTSREVEILIRTKLTYAPPKPPEAMPEDAEAQGPVQVVIQSEMVVVEFPAD